MVQVDRKVVTLLENSPEGLYFMELVRKSGFTDKTVRKACDRLRDNKQIDYPEQKKNGMKVLVKYIFKKKKVFKKFKNPRKFKAEVSKRTPIIFEWYNKDLEPHDPIEVYGAQFWKIDFRKKLLNVSNAWFFNDEKGWEEFGPLDFNLKEVKDIHAPIDINDFDEMLELWENPTLRFEKGIICNWDGRKTSHSKECNSSLHEIMRSLKYRALYSCRDKKEESKVKKDVAEIVEFILKNGGKIPFTGI